MGLIPEKTELLYGQIYQKIPKSPLHSALILRLLKPLRSAAPPGCHVRQEHPITCSESEPEPGLSIIRGSIEDYVTEHPHTAELVIEVCVSSEDYDRWKLSAYAGAGVKEVWLVLAPHKQIEVHRQPAGERFRERVLHGPGGQLTAAAAPGFVVELDALFPS